MRLNARFHATMMCFIVSLKLEMTYIRSVIGRPPINLDLYPASRNAGSTHPGRTAVTDLRLTQDRLLRRSDFLFSCSLLNQQPPLSSQLRTVVICMMIYTLQKSPTPTFKLCFALYEQLSQAIMPDDEE